jgi:type III secretory pathway component EscT
MNIEQSHTTDMQGIQGTFLTIMFFITGEILTLLKMDIHVLEILQGLAYFCSILLFIDTITGNSIKKYITGKLHKVLKNKKNGKDN